MATENNTKLSNRTFITTAGTNLFDSCKPIKFTIDTDFKNDIFKVIPYNNEPIFRKKVPLPERYIINENATILFWKNGEKTIVKKAEDDEFNPRLAFLTAFFQHYCGMSKNKANKYLAGLEVEKPKEKEEKVEEPKKKRGRPRKDSYKFQVGDKVIGNKLANERYNITNQGWRGTVTKTGKDYFVAKGSIFEEGIALDYKYFDKYEGGQINE